MTSREDTRNVLLRQLEQIVGSGHAEFAVEDEVEFGHSFYPIPEHIRALDPHVALVLGDRGAGKTELFKAIQLDDIRPAIAAAAPTERIRTTLLKPIRWRIGFSGAGTEFPNARRTRDYFRALSNRESAEDFWYAYLVRALGSDIADLVDDIPAGISELMAEPGAEVQRIVELAMSTARIAVALDKLDEALERRDQYLVVSYDALDAFGGADQEVMSNGVRALLRFWTEHIRRWHRIRPKMFLRTDLFRTYSDKLGADFAKLSAQRTEIFWNDRYLYTILVKRLLNAGTELRQFLQSSAKLRDIKQDAILGYVPSLLSPDAAKPLIDRLAGPYMGANPKKGATYRWVVDHVKDGNGHALPRAFLRLFAGAAREELGSIRRTKRLLDWSSLRQAIDGVSRDQVDQARNEWPWIDGMHQRLADQLVPMQTKVFEKLLGVDFDDSWGGGEVDVEVRPPAADARELLATCLELGIASERGRDRIDVPDLYAAGLGLKRQGGVRKR